jgi:hypothetical protein
MDHVQKILPHQRNLHGAYYRFPLAGEMGYEDTDYSDAPQGVQFSRMIADVGCLIRLRLISLSSHLDRLVPALSVVIWQTLAPFDISLRLLAHARYHTKRNLNTLLTRGKATCGSAPWNRG